MRYLFAFPLLLLAPLPFSANLAQAQSYSGPAVVAAPGYAGRVAMAQPPRQASASGDNLGGGLIEFLVTGGGGAPARPSYAPSYAPAPAPAYGGPAGAYNQPGAAPSYRRAAYALPPQQPNAYRRPAMSQMDPQFHRQEVAYDGQEAPGTIVVDTVHKFLFLVEPGGQAMRYGIGVGRPGFMWHGMHTITRKAEWPGWTPPADMLKRRPDLPLHMEGGPANPLGARAMYLGSTLYRIHGTNEPETIGKNVSSGCIRLTNEDVMDLYTRVRVGTRVEVL